MTPDPTDDTRKVVSNSTRRRVLRTLGTAAAAVPLGAGAVAGDNTDDSASPFDTSFDPEDDEAVARFISNTFDWSVGVKERKSVAEAEQAIVDQRKRVIKDLSEEQVEVVHKMLSDAELVVDKEAARKTGATTTGNGPSQESCNNYGDTVSAYIQVPFVGDTFQAFNFEVDIGWCVDDDEVINVSPSAIGNAQGYVLVNWDYQGISDENLTYHPDNYYATSYQKGKYNRCIVVKSGLSCVATDYGWIEAAVYNYRSGRTVDKGSDG
ncbi:hypothetical protein [Halorubrum tropicale]|uniref:hypothetical protein n=1 Tax=Halorubrum tropicale TaxID=1765655 RepID=UPI0011125EFB|nr:hypothetical protein [Halorubrum tropicale]